MAPTLRRSYKGGKNTVQAVIQEAQKPLDENDEVNDSGDVTYFVDEDGHYYYQPTQSIVSLPADNEEEIEQDASEVHAAEIAVRGVDGEPSIQTVTLMPSKNSNGEVSYVLVVQEETQEAGIPIKEEKTTGDVYKFEEDEEEEEEDEAVEEAVESEEPPTKKKRKGKSARASYTCNICPYSSHRRYLLIRHMKCHSSDRPFKCAVCERTYKTHASLQNHTNMHNGYKPYVCKSCEATFTTSGELARHVRYKHTHEKPHKCNECDYASVELSKLRRHIRSHTGERPYQCMDCTYASPDMFKLKRHQRTHTGEKPYKCEECNMCFTQSNSLKAHRLIHNVSEKPVFACELCPAKCSRKTDLRIHVQKLHTSDKPLKCKRCGKTFPDRYSCKMHNKTHEGEKCFKCDLCPYASTTLRHLKSHLLKHTDEKPFACEECDQTFRQKQLLRRHQNIYHNPEYAPKPPKEKSHTCGECGRSFAHKGNLIRHLEVHDPASGHRERSLALKLGRQKKVKYIEAETFKGMQDSALGRGRGRKGGSSELKRGELVTVDECDGQQFVVLEVIQLEDGTEQQVAVVAPDYLAMRRKAGEDDSEVIQVEGTEDDIVELETKDQIEMEEEMDEEEEEEEEEDMESKMQKHRQNQEKAAAERSIKLEQEVDTCFGFEEEGEEAEDEFSENVIFELV